MIVMKYSDFIKKLKEKGAMLISKTISLFFLDRLKIKKY